MTNNTEDEEIEISLDMDWVASLKKRVSDITFRDRNKEPKLLRVPNILKNNDPQAYEPSLVSLGPYHRGKSSVQAMNQHKWKCLKYVLENSPYVTLDYYLRLIKELEKPARDAYKEVVDMSSNNFVEMMLLDGFFLMLTIMGRNFVDEIWNQNEVIRDIFKLENQLPFFLLETLCSAFPYCDRDLFRLFRVEFIGSHFSINSYNMEPPSDDKTFRHIIHLCLSCIDPTTNHGNQSSNTFGFLCNSKLVKTVVVSWPSKLCSSLLSLVSKIRTGRNANPEEDLAVPGIPWIPSATVCNEAGIHFKRKQKAKSFLDITFHKGKLEIPQLYIGDSTNMLLRNLIAYEQCSMDSKFHVTSYMVLMDSLIDTAADVELLQQHEIIISDLGDSKEIATLFNKLGKKVSYDSDDFYLVDVFTAMRKHYDNRYNKLRAWFNRDYFFRRRWAFFSLFGALALFVLTTIQTTYTVLSYYLSSK